MYPAPAIVFPLHLDPEPAVSGRLDSNGSVEPFSMSAALDGVEGTLRGQPIGADGNVEIADGNVSVSNLRVDHGDSSASLDGALMAPAGLRFDGYRIDASTSVSRLSPSASSQTSGR